MQNSALWEKFNLCHRGFQTKTKKDKNVRERSRTIWRGMKINRKIVKLRP